MAGLIVLVWLVLAVVVGIGWSVFMTGAHQHERDLPGNPAAFRSFVNAGRVDLSSSARARRRRMQPPAA
jgi:hypothetical protein